MSEDKEKEKEAAEGEASESPAEGEKKGKKKKLVLIGLLVLMLVGGTVIGAVVTPKIMGKKEVKEEKKEGEEAADKSEDKEAADKPEAKKDDAGDKDKKADGKDAKDGKDDAAAAGAPAFVDIPEFLIDLNSDARRTSFLKLRLSLQVKNDVDKKKLEAVMPRIIDKFHTYLRELRVEDLRGSAGLYRLREELLTRANAVADPVQVTDVLFQEMLVQ